MPMARVNPTGVTAIDTMLGAVTVSAVDCEMPAKLAEMLVVPGPTVLTTPFEAMVAIKVEEELHATKLVRSALLPSL
jgi:hypothetical protein